MGNLVDFIIAHKEAFLAGALFVWSEVLGSNKQFKSSSVYQFVLNILKKVTGKSVQ